MKNQDFTEVEVIRGDKKVVWEYIGEGENGDYNPETPEEDTPLLRFSCFKYDLAKGGADGAWEEIPNSSYCTRMPINSSLRHLLVAAGIIIEALEKASYKHELRLISWFCPEDLNNKS